MVEGPRLIDGKKLCFGRKYTERRGKPCRGWSGAQPCSDKDECKQLFHARRQAGVTEEDDMTVPDSWETALIEVGGPSKNLLHAAEDGCPNATTITHEELEDLNEKILNVERLAVGQTLRYFCALGKLYLEAHSKMVWKEFRKWVEQLQGRSIVTILKYEQLARTVEKIGVDAADQLMNKPGLTLDKFIAIVRAVGPDNLLEAVDRKVENEDGVDVPVTALPLHRVKKELSPRAKIAKAHADMRGQAEDHDQEGDMGDEGYTEEPIPDGVTDFDPLPALAHLGNIKRLWRNNADAVKYGAVKLLKKDAGVLLKHQEFLRELLEDVTRFVERAKLLD